MDWAFSASEHSQTVYLFYSFPNILTERCTMSFLAFDKNSPFRRHKYNFNTVCLLKPSLWEQSILCFCKLLSYLYIGYSTWMVPHHPIGLKVNILFIVAVPVLLCLSSLSFTSARYKDLSNNWELALSKPIFCSLAICHNLSFLSHKIKI